MTVSTECPFCHRIFQLKPHRAADGKIHYCGHSCAARSSNPKRAVPIEENFWNHVEKTDHCWLWTARIDKGGYGQFHEYHSGKRYTITAHRFSYQLHKGPIPEGKSVCHDCRPLPDNRRCVHPNHLWLGTHEDNMMDGVAKEVFVRGEDNPQSKLTEKQVIEIRRLFATGKFTKEALGKQFAINGRTIGSVVLMRNWKHVT